MSRQIPLDLRVRQFYKKQNQPLRNQFEDIFAQLAKKFILKCGSWLGKKFDMKEFYRMVSRKTFGGMPLRSDFIEVISFKFF